MCIRLGTYYCSPFPLFTPFTLSPFPPVSLHFSVSTFCLSQVAVWYNVTGDLTCFDPGNTVTTTKPVKTAAEGEERLTVGAKGSVVASAALSAQYDIGTFHVCTESACMDGCERGAFPLNTCVKV